jgi:hypothetical protein
MAYLTCREGNSHGAGEQSTHVKQAVKYKDYDNIPSYVTLIRCNKLESKSNINTGTDITTIIIGYSFMVMIISLVLVSRVFK